MDLGSVGQLEGAVGIATGGLSVHAVGSPGAQLHGRAGEGGIGAPDLIGEGPVDVEGHTGVDGERSGGRKREGAGGGGIASDGQ